MDQQPTIYRKTVTRVVGHRPCGSAVCLSLSPDGPWLHVNMWGEYGRNVAASQNGVARGEDWGNGSFCEIRVVDVKADEAAKKSTANSLVAEAVS